MRMLCDERGRGTGDAQLHQNWDGSYFISLKSPIPDPEVDWKELKEKTEREIPLGG